MTARKISIEQEKRICSLYGKKSSSELAIEYKVSPSTIRSVWRRNSLHYLNEQRKFNPDITEFKKKYIGNTLDSVIKFYHKDRHTITNYAKKIGIYENKSRVLTKEQEQYVIDNYYTKSSTQLAEELDTSIECITGVWHRHPELRGKTSRTYYFNEDYFEEIDEPNKAYWLGFIASDGCIYKTRDSRQDILSFSLQVKDTEILEKFNKCLGSNKPVSYIEVKTPSGKFSKHVMWQQSSNKMCEDLRKYNLHPRKTYDYVFPDMIDKKYYKDFIRGYFDGDGTISKNITQNTLYSVNIGIVGFFKNLKKIQEILQEEDIKSILAEDKRKHYQNDKFGELTFTSKIAKVQFLHFIYDDAELYLDRKYELAQQFISLVKTGKKCWTLS